MTQGNVIAVVIIAKPKNHQQANGLEAMMHAWSQRHEAYVQVHRTWKLSEEDFQRLKSTINKAIDEVVD